MPRRARNNTGLKMKSGQPKVNSRASHRPLSPSRRQKNTSFRDYFHLTFYYIFDKIKYMNKKNKEMVKSLADVTSSIRNNPLIYVLRNLSENLDKEKIRKLKDEINKN